MTPHAVAVLVTRAAEAKRAQAVSRPPILPVSNLPRTTTQSLTALPVRVACIAFNRSARAPMTRDALLHDVTAGHTSSISVADTAMTVRASRCRCARLMKYAYAPRVNQTIVNRLVTCDATVLGNALPGTRDLPRTQDRSGKHLRQDAPRECSPTGKPCAMTSGTAQRGVRGGAKRRRVSRHRMTRPARIRRSLDKHKGARDERKQEYGTCRDQESSAG